MIIFQNGQLNYHFDNFFQGNAKYTWILIISLFMITIDLEINNYKEHFGEFIARKMTKFVTLKRWKY